MLRSPNPAEALPHLPRGRQTPLLTQRMRVVTSLKTYSDCHKNKSSSLKTISEPLMLLVSERLLLESVAWAGWRCRLQKSSLRRYAADLIPITVGSSSGAYLRVLL